MRLRKHGIWLLGASLAPHRVLADAGSLGGGQTINFNASQFVGDNPVAPARAVFVQPKQRTFNFTTTANITIANVFLRAVDDQMILGSNVDAAASPPMGTTTTFGPTIGIGGNVVLNTALPKSVSHIDIQQDEMIGRRDAYPVAMTFVSTPIPGGGINGEIIIPNLITPNNNPVEDHSLPFTYYNKVLYLEVNWGRAGADGGKSFSRYFAVTKPGMPPIDDTRVEQAFAQQEQQPTAASTASIGQPGLATSTPGADPSSGGASLSSSASSGSGPSGLSIGAIVGIAVGCGVVGLALAALLVFFLVRRRRDQAAYHDGTMTSGHASGRSYGAAAGAAGRHRTADLIAEKEATAGVTETPHSPYSDDGQPTHAEPNGSAATAMLHQGGAGEREYAPYSDQAAAGHDPAEPHHATPTDHARSGSTGGAQTPQLGGRYAHLVEEGMTSDEIARIEEEERQLDAAIEQAARH